jgi:hypothetical protein
MRVFFEEYIFCVAPINKLMMPFDTSFWAVLISLSLSLSLPDGLVFFLTKFTLSVWEEA